MEIHRFNQATQATNAWTPTGTILDGRRNAEADTLWDGTKLYVLTHMKDTDTSATDLGLKFQRFGYSTATKKYTLEASQDGGEQEGRGRGAGQGQHRQAVGHLHHREHRRRP